MIGLQPDSAGPSVPVAPKTPPREEWLTTAKRRAMDLIREGKPNLAFARFCSEICNHAELRDEFAITGRILDGIKAMHAGKLSTKEKMSAWIHSFT